MTCTIQVTGASAGSLAQQVADAQAAGVDGGEQQCAVPEHHHDQGAEAGDVDGAVARRERPSGR